MAFVPPILGNALLILSSLIVCVSINVAHCEEGDWRALDSAASRAADQRDFKHAIELAQEAVTAASRALVPNDVNRTLSMHMLGELYLHVGRNAEAETQFRQCLDLDDQNLSYDDPRIVLELSYLSMAYRAQGKFADARPILERLARSLDAACGAADCWRAQSASNSEDIPKGIAHELTNVMVLLSETYLKLGQRSDAANVLTSAINASSTLELFDAAQLATLEFQLGVIYYEQEVNEQAELWLRSAVETYKSLKSPSLPTMARLQHVLGEFYVDVERYSDARPLLTEALRYYEAHGELARGDIADTKKWLGLAQDALGNSSVAEELVRESLTESAAIHGKDSPQLAEYAMDLARVLFHEGSTQKADESIERAIKLYGNPRDRNHKLEEDLFYYRALVYTQENKLAEADVAFRHALREMHRVMEGQLQYQGEEISTIASSKRRNLIDAYFTFGLQHGSDVPTVYSEMYNILLEQKQRVLANNSMSQIRVDALQNTNANLGINLFVDKPVGNLLRYVRFKLHQLALSNGGMSEHERAQMRSLFEHEEVRLEDQLVRAEGPNRERIPSVTWQEVRDHLQRNEAAIEIYRFNSIDGRAHAQIPAMYAALVVTPNTTAYPAFIALGNAEELEDLPIKEYKQQVGIGAPRILKLQGRSFYDAFWRPIVPAVAGASRIYYAPDGVLNSVALSGVRSDAQEMIGDRYDIRLVASTRLLTQKGTHGSANDRTALLLGDPRYELSEDQQVSALRNPQQASLTPPTYGAGHVSSSRSVQVCGTSLDRLYASNDEVIDIGKFLLNHGWSASVFTQENALTTVVEKISRPRVLHIATHGVFLEDPTGTPENGAICHPASPMLRSMLFFAGADRLWARGDIPKDIADDGILTGWEVALLDLRGTELVVLSACDSGLGNSVDTEGILGLRRAFHEAGVESMLMSMWLVPDRETKELMESFYRHWIGDGKEKHEALHEAQVEEQAIVRQRYGTDDVHYWGGFVLESF